MQEITFTKGNEQHLKDCRDALCQSTLGERYFSSPGSAENAILEGIRQENLYVAFIGMKCQTSSSLLSRIIIRPQSGSMKETAISKLGKFQTCIVPESQNT